MVIFHVHKSCIGVCFTELLYEVINSYSDCRHEVDGIQYYCTVSGGIAVFRQEGSSYTELLINSIKEQMDLGENAYEFAEI